MNESVVGTSLAALLHTEIFSTPPQRIEGGCIHASFRYETSKGPVFVKVCDAAQVEMFEAEAAGLEELRTANAIRIPQVLGTSITADFALLALEWIELRSTTPNSDRQLGEQLAQLHRVTKPMYGWKRGNYIGATPQINLWSHNWLDFWRTHRFEPQLDQAVSNGAHARFIERAALLNTLMDSFFIHYKPQASLLHGDLWSGNYAADANGMPVVFDPAVYFGDRECDLAMTRLFGGFSREFYAAYENAWPLSDGWKERVDLYNLYHVLNHFNLFGSGYLQQAEGMIERLLSELGH
jgi:protein-ribulosamine 3-kinase